MCIRDRSKISKLSGSPLPGAKAWRIKIRLLLFFKLSTKSDLALLGNEKKINKQTINIFLIKDNSWFKWMKFF